MGPFLAVRARGTKTVEIDSAAVDPDPVTPGGSRLEAAWNLEFEILDRTAVFADEMVMDLDVAVVTCRAAPDGHLLDRAFRNQDLEIPVDGAEGETRKLGQQRLVQPGHRRVPIGGSQHREQPFPLAGVVPANRAELVGADLHGAAFYALTPPGTRKFRESFALLSGEGRVDYPPGHA